MKIKKATNPIEDFINFELDIEYEFELIEKEDWKGLLLLKEKQLRNHPDDLNAVESYAEALILNKKFQDAIDFIRPYYEKYYEEDGFGIHPIMDALIGLEKTENDFIWLKTPNILRLDNTTLNLSIKLLKGKRKPVSVSDLHSQLLYHCDYITFDDEELSTFLLKNSKHFNFTGDVFVKIKLK
jgi:hypothetical protein